MKQISPLLKQRFAELMLQADSSIHRHSQLSMAEELQQLSELVSSADSRDSYGQGGSITAFEQTLSQLFEQTSCVFLPTGTLAQCAAMKCYSEQSGRSNIALHPSSHLLLHEHRAIETLWGLKVSEIGAYQHVLSLNDVLQLNPNTTAAIIIETPMREIGGVLPSWQSLTEISAWCKEHQVKLHLDGARLWQASVYYQRSLAQIASLFDSIYLSFYKDLAGIFGAALLGSSEFIDEARVWARRAGGNPITLYPEVLAARAGLERYLAQMPSFVAYTKKVCQALSSAPLDIFPQQPQAAMFHLRIHLDGESLADKIVSYGQRTGIIALPLPRSGDQQSSTCEITIGEQAMTQEPAFWVKHIQACLRE